MNETEVWSEISKNLFQKKLKEFEQKFGKPKLSKRLAFRIGFRNNLIVNTRIRITDGEPEIMQKTGEWGVITKSESSFPLPKDKAEILRIFKYFRNIMLFKEDSIFYLLRFTNFIFETKDFEIKLTNQVGLESVFSFEVELKNEKLNIMEVCKDLRLKPNMESHNEDFWMKWNERINVDIKQWEDEKLLKIIEEYL